MESVFSRYEIKESAIKVSGADSVVSLNCVGSVDEELNTKTISKSCEGVVVKQVTRGDGTGTLTISLHMPLDLYHELHGMKLDELVDGVTAYGKNSIHKEFCYTAVVKDEDGVEMLVAYPKCIATSGPKASIENGAEEVAEVELEIGIMPDDYDNCKYEAIVDELDSSVTKDTWLSSFDPSMVMSATA